MALQMQKGNTRVGFGPVNKIEIFFRLFTVNYLPSLWSDSVFTLMYVVDLTPSPTEMFFFFSAVTILSTCSSMWTYYLFILLYLYNYLSHWRCIYIFYKLVCLALGKGTSTFFFNQFSVLSWLYRWNFICPTSGHKKHSAVFHIQTSPLLEARFCIRSAFFF